MQVFACRPLETLARPAPAWPRLAACWLLCLLALTAGAMGATPEPEQTEPPEQVQTQGRLPEAVATSMVAMAIAADSAMAKSARMEKAPAPPSAVRRWGLRALALGVGAGLGWAFLRLGASTAKRKKPAPNEGTRA